MTVIIFMINFDVSIDTYSYITKVNNPEKGKDLKKGEKGSSTDMPNFSIVSTMGQFKDDMLSDFNYNNANNQQESPEKF